MTAQEDFVERLRAACASGYYRPDEELNEVGNVALGRGTMFPWQNKSCGDCRWWRLSICHVHGEYRGRFTHTCRYFDHPQEAEQLARERAWGSKPSWFGGGPWL